MWFFVDIMVMSRREHVLQYHIIGIANSIDYPVLHFYTKMGEWPGMNMDSGKNKMLTYELVVSANFLKIHSIQYRRHGQIHRLNGPAWFWAGIRLTAGWMQYGQYHREIGYSVRYNNGRGDYHRRGIPYDPEI